LFSYKSPPAAGDFLRDQPDALLPETLFRAYARYLLRSAGIESLPVPLERIRERHRFQRQQAPLAQRGFLLGDAIFINSDDTRAVQRFTEAHEMMEALVNALREEGHAHLAPGAQEEFEAKKETWCEFGAAELLMPAELFFPQVQEWGVSLKSARHLAEACQTSLTATVRRMIAVDDRPYLFVLLKEGHKKSEFVPSKVGQGVLWGEPADWDPPAELRVWRRWSTANKENRVVLNESFARDGTASRALQARAFGEILSGHDELDLEFIQGRRYVEAMLVTIAREPVVMALVHLEEAEG
jgi:hypothetical protein